MILKVFFLTICFVGNASGMDESPKLVLTEEQKKAFRAYQSACDEVSKSIEFRQDRKCRSEDRDGRVVRLREDLIQKGWWDNFWRLKAAESKRLRGEVVGP